MTIKAVDTHIENTIATGLEAAITKDVQHIASSDNVTLAQIKGVLALSTALVADKVGMSFLYQDGTSPPTGNSGDPTISFSILGQNFSYTFLPSVSFHDIVDAGAVIAGASLSAGGLPEIGVPLAVYGAYDLLSNHLNDITGVTVNGQNPTASENTALPPIAFDAGEPEPDGDSDDGPFVSQGLAQLNIPGYSDFLHSTFPGYQLS